MNTEKNQNVSPELGSKENNQEKKEQTFSLIVDREKYTVANNPLTGNEILTLAGKVPTERFQLNVRNKGGKVVKVDYMQAVDLSDPGIEKFMTIPLDQSEG